MQSKLIFPFQKSYNLKLNRNSVLVLYKIMISVQIQQFEEVFQRLCDQKVKCVMIFTSEEDQSGKYWCQSCQKIVEFYPDIEKRAKQIGLEIYRFVVGNKQNWNKDHPFKTNPLIGLTTIPIMGLFDGQKVSIKLNGDEIVQQKQRDLFFEFAIK